MIKRQLVYKFPSDNYFQLMRGSTMTRIFRCLLTVTLLNMLGVQAFAITRTVPLLKGERFWGGCVTDGRSMPFGKERFTRDLYGNTGGNQAQPLLISLHRY